MKFETFADVRKAVEEEFDDGQGVSLDVKDGVICFLYSDEKHGRLYAMTIPNRADFADLVQVARHQLVKGVSPPCTNDEWGGISFTVQKVMKELDATVFGRGYKDR
jgi:hypothetical protein